MTTMTLPATPDWLQLRGGELRLGYDGHTVYVLIEGEPLYELVPIPVTAQHGCRITATVNGKPIACNAVCATVEEALRAGLEDLRKTLGW